MRALDASDVLTLWERAAPRHVIDRAALLCAWARPDLPAERITDLPLGSVTESLLRLHEASFGPHIDGHVDCPHCGTRLALALLSSDLLQPVVEGADIIDVDGRRLRAPCLRDLAAIASEPDIDRAARQLLARCIRSGPADATVPTDEALREAEDALEKADPNMDLSLSVHCAACGGHSVAQLDVGVLLWDEIEGRARTLLSEVDVLARAYGWTESEILALSPARRATYLAMVPG
jgi:hypothetical protein